MIATLQLMLLALFESSILSTIELSQSSIDSLNQLTTIISITLIPLSIILVYAFYTYIMLKNNKAKIPVDQ